MTLPTTFEEQETRLREIRRQLVELHPQHEEILHTLKTCQAKIEGLCAEKWRIERSRIKITVCKTGQSGRRTTDTTVKPVDTKKVVASLDPAQTQELLLMLMRMQREMAAEEHEDPAVDKEVCEVYELEPYDPEDEEEEDESRSTE